jgi:serine/threonine protein kinase
MDYTEPSFGERYLLHRLVGRGRFALVYLAWDCQARRLVALKIAHEARAEAVAQHPFSQEAGRLFLLRHPHIVDLLDYTLFHARPALVMEYVPSTLQQRYQPEGKRQQPLPAEDMLSYIQQAASALEYAHTNGVIHCDIKPQNILLNEHGLLKISDFGIAVLLPAFSTRQGMGGTREYRAPEGYAGPQADQYSLAVTVYEGLAGHRPGLGKGLRALQTYLFPTSCRAALLSVLTRALARRPKRRFQSMQTFADTCTQAYTRAQTHPARARPLVSLVTLCLLILLGVGLPLLALPGRQTSAPRPAHVPAIPDVSATALLGEQIYQQATSKAPALSSSLAGPDGNRWQHGTGATGSCTFSQGSYQVVSQHTNTRLSCLEEARRFSDLACQAEMRIASTPGDYGGLVVRASSDSGYVFLLGTDQRYKFGVIGKAQALATGSSSAIFTAPTQWNRLTIIARGSTFYLYINQQFLRAVSDASTTQGLVGLSVEDNSSPTRVLFRNLQVWSLT